MGFENETKTLEASRAKKTADVTPVNRYAWFPPGGVTDIARRTLRFQTRVFIWVSWASWSCWLGTELGFQSSSNHSWPAGGSNFHSPALVTSGKGTERLIDFVQSDFSLNCCRGDQIDRSLSAGVFLEPITFQIRWRCSWRLSVLWLDRSEQS